MTKKKLLDLCKTHGIIVYDDGDTVGILAPRGKLLSSTHVHEISIWHKHYRNNSEIFDILYKEALHGVHDCDDEDCEWCSDAELLPYGLSESDVLKN
jgi:hypothetical protein